MCELTGGCDSAEFHRTRPSSEGSGLRACLGWYPTWRGGLIRGEGETYKTVGVLDDLNPRTMVLPLYDAERNSTVPSEHLGGPNGEICRQTQTARIKSISELNLTQTHSKYASPTE